MQEKDYPALYKSADALSLNAQRQFFGMLKANLALLVIATIFSGLPASDWRVPTAQTLVLLAALGSSIYLAARRPDQNWYAGRAVAESVKTTTWRYMMRAEPFDGDDDAARRTFQIRLQSIIKHNEQIAGALTHELNEPPFSEAMQSIRSRQLDDRRQLYSATRIRDQLDWYSRKSAANANWARRFFSALIAVNGVAVIFAVLRLRLVSPAFWPTDVLVVMAASVLGWIQARRYSELSASYALSAHEISVILEDCERAMSESEFSEYVSDAESAFSREHTQWVARSDR